MVAWKLLSLTYALREHPEQPAQSFFDAHELDLLQNLSGRSLPSVRCAVLALTRILGFAPSKKQPFPGVKVLATAIERFFFIKIGAHAFSKPLQD